MHKDSIRTSFLNSEETYYWRAWMFLVCSHCVFEIVQFYPKWIYFPPITRVAFWVWLLWISCIDYDYLQRGWWDWEPRFRNLGLNTYLRSQSVLLRSLSIDFAWALYSIIHFKLSESREIWLELTYTITLITVGSKLPLYMLFHSG